ncbi:MAG: oligosaccharide flippase family protein [Pseudomonadota bacterium]
MVKRNLIANYLSAAWSGLMGLVFLPVYIDFLGVEAFGLIGAFAVLQGWFALLDMGLSPTLNREMARFSAGAHTPQGIRNLLHTMEVIYLGIALVLAGLVMGYSDWIAVHWLKAGQLPVATIAQALAISGVIVACRWMTTLYRSTLLGLQRQVWLSVSTAGFATLRGAGVIVVLALVSPTIQAFFLFQGLVALLEMLVLGMQARRSLPVPPQRPVFSLAALKGVWEFAAGMTLITILATLLMQVDKLLLSTLLPLAQFGYFTLATMMAGTLSLFIGPIANVAYPRFTELVEQRRQGVLVEQYHKLSQLLSCIVLPVALVLCFFAHEVVWVWTGNSSTADAVAPVLSVWVVGSALNGLMHTPYLAQLAHGWSRLTVIVNAVAVAIIVPALLVLVPRYGVMVAAWIWVAINATYILVSITVMHRRILRGEKWRWYWNDVLQPLLAGALVAALLVLAKSWLPQGGRVAGFLFLAMAGLAVLAATALATPLGRGVLRQGISSVVRA